MELIGLAVNFIATVVIVMGDKMMKHFGFCLDEEDPFDAEDYEEMVEGR